MAIQGIIFDLSDTLLDSNGIPVIGIPELLDELHSLGLTIIVVSNNNLASNLLSSANLGIDFVITQRDVSIRKPSPKFIDSAIELSNISKSKLIYVGDNDKTDAICASHRKMLYLSSGWANDDPKYGIKIPSQELLLEYIKNYLLKNNSWYWKFDGLDKLGRTITVRSLLNCGSSSTLGRNLKDVAVSILKRGILKGKFFLMNQLITSLYLDEIVDNLDYWTTYPGHKQGSTVNDVMSPFLERGAKEFRNKYKPLFIRNTLSVKSAFRRHHGGEVNFENQIKTVHLNPEYKDKIDGRAILVLDDFTTESLSFEWARNLLLEANAKNVICVSVGKYSGNKYTVFTPTSEVHWNPFEPCSLDGSAFTSIMHHGDSYEDASSEIEIAYDNYINLN